jgi:Protein of unknown function/Domain of unknown function (DUF1835)
VTTHVAFGESAAGSLKIALRALGRTDEVLYLTDDMAFGPIAPTPQRMSWATDELGLEAEPEREVRIGELWARLAGMRTPITLWMSRYSATEYCGLLAIVSAVEHAPISFVDIGRFELTARNGTLYPVNAFAIVPDRYIVENGLADAAVLLSADQLATYRAEWNRLRGEKGAFRVMTPKGIVTVPITCFDAQLLASVTNGWTRSLRVIGNTIGQSWTTPYRQCSSDRVLFARLLALIDDGTLEGLNDDDQWTIESSSVRLIG